MIVEEDLIPFLQWLPFAALAFIVISLALSVLGALFGYVVASFRHGPVEAFYVVSRVFFDAFPDLIGTSPRRVWAIAKLAMRETIRRKVLLVAFAIFATLILIGGWFLDTKSDNPERVYIGFLGWGTQLLVIMLGLMISAFSLPADIKNKTIYTITTKPVRATEIVFGRIVGFVLVGTLLLSSIWIVSYFFILRGLEHSHTMELQTVQEVDGKEVKKYYQDVVDGKSITGGRVAADAIGQGETTFEKHHRHMVEYFEVEEVDEEGNKTGKVSIKARAVGEKGHTHLINENDDGTYTVGPPTGNLLARVPVYANSLLFQSREGDIIRTGYRVGNEWNYRSYIDGGESKAAALFFFQDIFESRFNEDVNKTGLPLNVQVSVFRSYKGDVDKRISASIYLASLQDEIYEYETLQAVDVFETQEYAIQTRYIPRKIRCRRTNKKDESEPPVIQEFDLFDDIAKDGKLTLILKCNEEKQYIGVAKKDVFFRPANKPFFQNFLKAYLGIWLQLVVVVSLGVMFSTFLSSIVALLATISGIVLGLYSKFLQDIAYQRVEGGGPIESFYRIVTQENMMNPLEGGIMAPMIKAADLVIVYLMTSLAYIMPEYGKISFFQFIADGYNIEWQRLLVGTVLCLSFCLVTTIIGYFCLKTREIAG